MAVDSVSTIFNTTTHATASPTSGSVGAMFQEIFLRMLDMISAPVKEPDMIWIVIPLVISTIIMVFYLRKYSKEGVGWDNMVGNALVLVFVSLDLLSTIYKNPHLEVPIEVGGFYIPIKTIVAILILLEGFALLYINYFRWMSKRIAFFVTSTLPVNLTAYLAIVIVYSNIPLDWITILAALIIFFILLLLFRLLKVSEYKPKRVKD
jgi:hypothetical protein